MKLIGIITFLLLTTHAGFSQNQSDSQQNDRKGKFYLYWGWNRGWFSKSDINFKGTNYDFTLKKVVSKDRQSKFNLNTYFNPLNATIPQYNFRVGYFINNNYNISFGNDHMKYVVQGDQIVKISGSINSTETVYDGTYTNDDIAIKKDFLEFEHTDGLNYENIEFRRIDEIIVLNKIIINLTEGLGMGILLPRTDATLLNNKKHNKFHLSGYGVSSVVGINIAFYKFFFAQTEFKAGFINMPDIRITSSKSDKASQSFFFTQLNIVFGATLNLKNNKTKANKK